MTTRKARGENAKWGPPVGSPGGTMYQINTANGKSVKRTKSTTPGGKNEVLHQFCIDDLLCSVSNPCTSCKTKNPQADRNARAKARSITAKPTDQDESCGHSGESNGALATQTTGASNHLRRERYKERSAELNKARRAKNKVVFSKADYDLLKMKTNELMGCYESILN